MDAAEDVLDLAREVVAEQMRNNPAFSIYDIAAAAVIAERVKVEGYLRGYFEDGLADGVARGCHHK